MPSLVGSEMCIRDSTLLYSIIASLVIATIQGTADRRMDLNSIIVWLNKQDNGAGLDTSRAKQMNEQVLQ